MHIACKKGRKWRTTRWPQPNNTKRDSWVAHHITWNSMWKVFFQDLGPKNMRHVIQKLCAVQTKKSSLTKGQFLRRQIDTSIPPLRPAKNVVPRHILHQHPASRSPICKEYLKLPRWSSCVVTNPLNLLHAWECLKFHDLRSHLETDWMAWKVGWSVSNWRYLTVPCFFVCYLARREACSKKLRWLWFWRASNIDKEVRVKLP